MRRALLGLTLAYQTAFALPQPSSWILEQQSSAPMLSWLNPELSYLDPASRDLNEIKWMFREQAPELGMPVVNKVLAALACARANHVEYNNMLTLIDYALPSSEKRLWVFDLNTKKLLFHTYVSHGINSGTRLTRYFSNQNNSKASSLGVYTAVGSYYGREGVSLRLAGLDKGFNDNAGIRYIVMHGGWYMDENFIKKYGRPGRSWGCPAVPLDLSKAIINTIKDQSLLVIYYPSDQWFLHSKFLNCSLPPVVEADSGQGAVVQTPLIQEDKRAPILFADLNKNNSREENEPIVVMDADNYQRIFHAKAPLDRMLRRQIDHQEYIALSQPEFEALLSSQQSPVDPAARTDLSIVHFVIPEVILLHGYYETQMKMVVPGKIKKVSPASNGSNLYWIEFENGTGYGIKTTKHFIRWLGL